MFSLEVPLLKMAPPTDKREVWADLGELHVYQVEQIFRGEIKGRGTRPMWTVHAQWLQHTECVGAERKMGAGRVESSDWNPGQQHSTL